MLRSLRDLSSRVFYAANKLALGFCAARPFRYSLFQPVVEPCRFEWYRDLSVRTAAPSRRPFHCEVGIQNISVLFCLN
jgi:hypothetical protein